MVVDTDHRPRFCTFLLPEEKAWIVGRINYHLGAKERPKEIIGEYEEEPRFRLSSEGELLFFDDWRATRQTSSPEHKGRS